MTHPYPHLFSPIKIGNLTLKNRIIAAPTSLSNLTPEGHLTNDVIAYFELKAQGGCSVVTVGESIVEGKTGRSHDRQVTMDDPHVLPSLTNAVKAINRHNCVANIELSHGGKFAGLPSIGGVLLDNGAVPYGPSDDNLDGVQIREMPREMIFKIVDAWGASAAKAKRAGFEMVMVHAAHGWLFNQFLSPLQNHRTDEFGGSLENRARFLTLSLDKIREAVGPGFPIELRMNGDDFIDGAMHLEDYLELAKLLDPKVDLFNISCGSHDEKDLFVRTHPSMFLPRGCNVYLAAAIKKVVTKPVSCVGALSDPAVCEEIIASGQADIVEMARALIADPFLPQKSKNNCASDIRPCLRCFVCLGESTLNNTIRCAVNPVIGNELDHKNYCPPPERKKKVLVAGGGPGGMEAAITAAKRGHDVILCETSGSLGGNLKHAKFVDFKSDLYQYEQWLELQLKKTSARICLNTHVTPDLVREIAPDALIVMTGALPFYPPIPGIHGPNIVSPEDAESHPEQLGEQVVIIGGGLVGCEAAISISRYAKTTTVVEMRDKCAADVNEFEQLALFKELSDVQLRTNCIAKEVRENGLIIRNEKNEDELLPFTKLVCAAGLKSDTDTVDALTGLVSETYVLGDGRRPRQITQAVSEAYYAAKYL